MKRLADEEGGVQAGQEALGKRTKQEAASGHDLEEEKKLSEMIRFKKKFSSKKAKLILTLTTVGATLDDEEHEEASAPLKDGPRPLSKEEMPLYFVQDLQRVILFSLIGDQFRFYPRWCKILRPKFIRSIQLITVNNFSEYDYQVHKKRFKKLNQLFLGHNNHLNSIEFVSASANGSTFFKEFTSVPITRNQWLKIRDLDEFKERRAEVAKSYRALYNNMTRRRGRPAPGEAARSAADNTSELDRIPRTSLLLNLNQMIREDYPIPFDESQRAKYRDYVYTKERYEPVDDRASALFAIDCEMCYNVDGEMEIVWIAVVNESGECVYESFVKPAKAIKNYLTFITGVRAETLENVTVTLKDVQTKLQELLPANAILCGQSLNNDLHALRMFHPYIIDTGIIYNLSGNRDIKPALRRLSAQFLGKLIQEGSHNPVIDAKASLQLVLLKLRQSLDFGDVIINGCTNVYDDNHLKDSFNMGMDGLDLSDPSSISRFIYQTGLNIDQSFFNILRDNDISNIYADHERFESNRSALMPDSVERVFAADNDRVKQVHLEHLNKKKFSWMQYYLKSAEQTEEVSHRDHIDSSELKDLVKFLVRVYEELEDDTLVMIAFTGRDRSTKTVKTEEQEKEDGLDLNDLNKGKCFLKLKCAEMDSLESQVRELYAKIKLTK